MGQWGAWRTHLSTLTGKPLAFLTSYTVWCLWGEEHAGHLGQGDHLHSEEKTGMKWENIWGDMWISVEEDTIWTWCLTSTLRTQQHAGQWLVAVGVLWMGVFQVFRNTMIWDLTTAPLLGLPWVVREEKWVELPRAKEDCICGNGRVHWWTLGLLWRIQDRKMGFHLQDGPTTIR